jgi:hypothetical protein
MRRVAFTVLLSAAALLSSVFHAAAMDRWSALSMLESGDNDRAVGPGGEVSRFQIQRVLWPGGNPSDSKDALSAAREVMQPRLAEFQKAHGRAPTDFEFYVLWNAPMQLNHPSKAVSERAKRFANLVQREDLARR